MLCVLDPHCRCSLHMWLTKWLIAGGGSLLEEEHIMYLDFSVIQEQEWTKRHISQIARLFQNRFRPLNLDKLWHLKGWDDMYRDQIAMEDGSLRLRKVTGLYQDYSNDEVLWSEAFPTYMSVMVTLFGTVAGPPLTLALTDFHREIAKVYRWQGGRLSFGFRPPYPHRGGSPNRPYQVGNPGQMVASFLQPPHIEGNKG